MLEDFLIWVLGNYLAILLVLTTAFGAAGMYVFSDYQGFENSKNFLKAQFPRRAPSFYARMDFLIVVVAGTIIGTICFEPGSYMEAMAAGFGWTGAMNVFLNGRPSGAAE